jgi:small nuclear ribonucleoprotein (snRNP)-like protein
MSRYTRNTKNDRQQQEQQQKISVSLGKPSLRLRLEAYYNVMAPDQIADTTAWRSRYDQIWEKFGGSEAGEKKLATKLAKKYGKALQLQLTTDNAVSTSTTTAISQQPQHDEAWFELNEKERSSGDLCFTSSSFDPVAALQAKPQAVVAANDACMDSNTTRPSSMLLDRVEQYRPYLPQSDPQFQQASRKRPNNNTAEDEGSNKKKKQIKPLGSFTEIASMHETGPLSVLHRAFVQRARVRVLIRYVNGIRGTLTGTLLAFDKHFNLILRDVEEVYSRRLVTNDADSAAADDDNITSRLSNAKMEIQRRIQGLASFHDNSNRHLKSRDSGEGAEHHASTSWSCRQRSMRQIMVRGDNVVSVYRADMERSAWPVTSKSPKETLYRKQSVPKRLVVLPREERIGTPGSLSYAAAASKRRRQQHQQRYAKTGPSAAAGRKHDYRS